MSDTGTILDALITHAEATDAEFVGNTTRGVLARGEINDEDYPHFFAYNPRISSTRIPFRQKNTVGEYPVAILTKGETQEQLLTRVEAFVARIDGDRTIGGEVDLADVSSVDLSEDPRTKIKFAELIVRTEALE